MENAHKKQQVALSSVLASLLLTIMKLVVGIMSGSIGIISEAAHSALDLGAASLTLFAVNMSSKPADRKHHYGHAKVESVSALIETALLVVTSIWIIYAATERLLAGSVEIEVKWYAIAIMVISIVVDFSRSRALKKVAKETNSQALEADALHFSSDILSSAVVLLGLIFVSLGIAWADAVAGIAVALLVGWAAFNLGKKTIDVLIDAAPEGITDRLEEITMTVSGVISIDKVRVKPTGPQVFIEMAVCINRTLSVEKVQRICSDIEKRVRDEFPVGDITINTRPIALNSETIAERIHVIGLNHNLHAHNISTNLTERQKQITFDVEIDQQLTIKQAHDTVNALEEELHREFDGELNICIHLDPLRNDECCTTTLQAGEEKVVRDTIINAAQSIRKIQDVHDIQIRKTDKEKLFITLHCSFNDEVLLEEVHSLTSQLEGAIYRSLPNAGRVIIHAEPLFA
ncbi:cation diffusion facilitator family transporter [Pelodictyon phaeoclathratiforme]|jgi:cation diffusion facilitator family transporter|uniref:Cation diffusion facilitator family transporter n=1 Tax=Pelodictyon phaeoclathratiforme (strain DSM 5477 / BU-1) TaxID=324925 RepID=B4SEY7_PELPB|nr:cation diffusion facilitator family transporter [Pelodictyon phaeoclathratiforme]ACF43134.1 cation diffusion facilitator family transporter [Pelodictyon phaeoclathratiforme BU-1]MBV5289939.1 cation diffusion facilitator family transporter [Pelodictyon phaeoclathratiforme]